jgi:hypothetical protein
MPQERTDECGKPESQEREFGERLAYWWNHGAEAATQNQATTVTYDAGQRKAA